MENEQTFVQDLCPTHRVAIGAGFYCILTSATLTAQNITAIYLLSMLLDPLARHKACCCWTSDAGLIQQWCELELAGRKEGLIFFRFLRVRVGLIFCGSKGREGTNFYAS